MRHLFIIILMISNLILLSKTLKAQNKGSIIGIVSDSLGNPVSHALIGLKNTPIGSMSDKKGHYNITDVPAGDYEIVFSYLGFETIIKTVTVQPDQASQVNFSARENIIHLPEVYVKGLKSKNGIGHLSDTVGTVIYSGKKTEVLILDSLDANTAQNNPRQILGRIPGMNFSETEGNGFPSNGIGSRGLNPTQSIEMNSRQNGYNITSDIYGYNEAYYTTPMDAVQRVELVRGASSLQFGPQFGGTVNYITKDAPTDKKIQVSTQQTAGSYGLFTSSNSIAGTIKKFSYYGFGQYKSAQGWRPNSDFRAFSGFGKIEYKASKKIKLGLEYSLLRNRIHMPGGLSDEQYSADSRQSFRARNWLNSPWNILTANIDYKISTKTTVSVKSTYLFSQRNLVWRNEDGGPGALDIKDSTGNFVSREVESEKFKSSTTEARLLTNYRLFGMENTFATGVRVFQGKLYRAGGGPGSTGTDFDLNLYGGGYEYALTFRTTNFAYFFENIFRITSRFSVTPGFRFEYINSSAKGYTTAELPSGDDTILNVSKSRQRYIPLAGLGLQYKTGNTTTIYGNISQAYRPMDYSSLTPLGVTSRIDPNIKDAYGFNSDLGWKGTAKDFLNFDISLFYLAYNNRIGIVSLTDEKGNPYTYRTNVANSVHKGLEAYVEFNPTKMCAAQQRLGSISIFNSFAYIDARYVKSNPNLIGDDGNPIQIKGNRVEYAPKVINRTGLTYSFKGFSITYTLSYTGKSFGDANNTVMSPDAVAGIIPAYKVMDLAGGYKIKNYHIKAGINNLANKKYFTKRTDEYPGPGIIPSMARSFYISLGARF